MKSSPKTKGQSGGPTIEIIKVPEGVPRWHLVHQFLNVREEVFVQGLGWDLNTVAGTGEFEQYDTFDTVYAIAHEKDRVIGGGRLLRTDNKNGIYTYMIKDACAGSLPGMPEDLCFRAPPASSKVWELTRFFSDGRGVTTALLLAAIVDYLKSEHATECLILGSPAFPRRARVLGYELDPIGPIVANDDCKFQAFSCALK